MNLMTVQEFCELLRINAKTESRWRKDGVIPKVLYFSKQWKRRQTVRYIQDEVEKWVDIRTRRATAGLRRECRMAARWQYNPQRSSKLVIFKTKTKRLTGLNILFAWASNKHDRSTTKAKSAQRLP